MKKFLEMWLFILANIFVFFAGIIFTQNLFFGIILFFIGLGIFIYREKKINNIIGIGINRIIVSQTEPKNSKEGDMWFSYKD
jgi:hypothetical protein